MLNNQEISAPALIEDLGMIFATEKSKEKKRYGLYKCHCGNVFKSPTRSINNGTRSCGCLQKETARKTLTTHGLGKHKMYNVWNHIMQRCTNKKDKNFRYYGGRGIKVCDRWLDINNFIEDMYPTFKEGMTIDRINNDGNYELSNCRWVSQKVQNCNTRVLRSTNTSGYRGVVFNKNTNKWVSQIGIDYKHIAIGRFNTPLEAAQSYDNYIILHNLEHTKNFS